MSSKRKWLKKLLAVSLSAAIIGGAGAVAPISITGSALTASAAETTDTEIPSGYTAVYDIADLYNIRSNPKGKYILMNDIDLSATAPGGDWDCGTGWETIVSFSGVLDGNGHTLSDLYLNGSRFIRDNKGTIKNLNIRSMHLSDSSYSGERVCFVLNNSGKVDNITVEGTEMTSNGATICFIVNNSGEVDNINVEGTGVTSGEFSHPFVYTNTATIKNVHITDNTMKSEYSPILCYENISAGCIDCCSVIAPMGCMVCSLKVSDPSYQPKITRSFCNITEGYMVCFMTSYYKEKSVYISYYGGNRAYYERYPAAIKDSYCMAGYVVYYLDGKLTRIGKPRSYGSLYKTYNDNSNTVKYWNGSVGIKYTQGDIVQVGRIYDFSLTGQSEANYSGLDFKNTWEMAPDGSHPQLKDNREITVSKIDVTRMPPKTVYNAGEDLVKIGEITVTCSNGKTGTANLSETVLSGYDMNKVGKQQVKVSYKGGEGYFEITVNPIKATGITLNKTDIRMNKSETCTELKATVLPDNTTDKTVTWSSSNTSVAKVDDSGVVTAVGVGSAVITAKTSNGKATICTVNVVNPAKSIELQNIELNVGANKTLKPVITPSDTTSKISWSSSDPSVATVNERGLVKAVSRGRTQITAKASDGPYAVCIVSVQAPTKKLNLSATEKTVYTGKTFKLKASVNPSDTTDTVICSADRNDIISVEPIYKTVQVYDSVSNTYYDEQRFTGCNVTALAKGEANVTVYSSNGKSTTCKIIVKQSVNNIVLDNNLLEIELGETSKLTATIEPAVNDETITWTSSKPEIVEVDSDGIITTKSTGTASIKVKSSNGKYALCKVTVIKTATDIQLDSTNLNIEKGKTKTVDCTLTPADSTDKITWTSSDTSVATVKNGKITAVNAGTAQITATTTGGLSETINVTVKVFAKSISLNYESLDLIKGGSEVLTVTFDPDDTTNKTLTWTTSDSKVATVKNGKVKAVGAGSAVITAKSANGKTASCTVSVIIVPNKVVLNKTDITINKGTQTNLTATVYPSASENKSLTWKSSNPSVATVDSDGTINAVSSGTAIITAATFNEISASCTVKVVTKPTSIKLNQTSLTIKRGGGTGISATVLPSNADDKSVTWSSSDTSVATVTGGYISGKKVGTATITATTVNGLKATCKVTVKEPDVLPTSVSISKTSLSLTKGNSATLSAVVSPSNATNKSVGWTSSNTTVATVKDGVVTAKSVGTATITVKTYNGKTATCNVTVTNPVVNPTSVTLNKTSLSLTVGNTSTLTATVNPSNATNKSVTWSSSNTSVASVSSGRVTAKSAGTATITAKTSNGKTATCKVTVKNSQSVETEAQKNFMKVANYLRNYGAYSDGKYGIAKKVSSTDTIAILYNYSENSIEILQTRVDSSYPWDFKSYVMVTQYYSSVNKSNVDITNLWTNNRSSSSSYAYTGTATLNVGTYRSGSTVSFSIERLNTSESTSSIAQTFANNLYTTMNNANIVLNEKGYSLKYLGYNSF